MPQAGEGAVWESAAGSRTQDRALTPPCNLARVISSPENKGGLGEGWGGQGSWVPSSLKFFNQSSQIFNAHLQQVAFFSSTPNKKL